MMVHSVCYNGWAWSALAASPSGNAPEGESIFVADLWMLQEFDSATGEFLGKVDKSDAQHRRRGRRQPPDHE